MTELIYCERLRCSMLPIRCVERRAERTVNRGCGTGEKPRHSECWGCLIGQERAASMVGVQFVARAFDEHGYRYKAKDERRMRK